MRAKTLTTLLAATAIALTAGMAEAKPRKAKKYRQAPVAQVHAGFGLFNLFNFGAGASMSFGSGDLVSTARSYIGSTASDLGLPRSLWCADFMNLVLEKTGREGTGSRMASSFASYGRRIPGPQIGAIAVMSRGKRGGHVGIVSGIDANGNPIIISGNHNRRVAEAVYPRSRIYAYVLP